MATINFPSNPALNATYTFSSKTWQYNGNAWVLQGKTPYTDNVIEGTNLYYTNARVYANVIGLIPNITLKANIADLTTSNVTEGSNLYFTNIRAIGAFTGGTGITILANGLIVGASTYSDANTYANVIGLLNAKANTTDLTTSNVIEGSNLYYTNARVYANIIGLIPNVALKANTADLTTSNVTEGSNLYYTNARVYANVIGLIPNIALKANTADLTTSNVIEGSNLYYTNARVYANVIGLLTAKANTADLTTSNVIEGSNLYFTNTRAVGALTAGQNIVIAANGLILSTASGGGGNYDNTNAYANVIVLLPNYTGNLKAGNANIVGNLIVGNANVLGTLYSSNIVSQSGIGGSITGANLISSNIIFANTIVTGAGTGGNITGANLIQSTYMRANVWESLYTTNVIEGANLYYTNARVYANVIGLIPSITNKANTADLTTTNVIEGANLYFTNTRAVGALTAGQNISIASNGLITSSASGGGGGGASNIISMLAVTDETSNITVGTAKISFRAPVAMTLSATPRASLSTVSTSGLVTCDIKLNGTSILHATNKLSIDANELTSTTAATPTSLVTTSIPDDSLITVDVTAAGTGAKGLKITIYS